MSASRESCVRLKKPLERSIRSGHPWLYRDALEPFSLEPGTVVRVLGKSQRFLARGLVDAGPIGVRVFTSKDEPIDGALFARRLDAALELRTRTLSGTTNAYRLLHGEGDRLPGVVCDVYATFAVLRLDGEAAGAWQARFIEWLREPLAGLGVTSLLLRAGRKQQQAAQLAYGAPPPDELVIEEHGMRMALSLMHGQKTGLFLDHRESRRRVREIARGLDVLNLYGYTGGFSVAAGLGGAARVTTVDSAPAALRHAESSWSHNGLEAERHQLRAQDVSVCLEELTRARARFTLIVADPPNFAPSDAARPRALESYAALHAAALGLLSAHGYYLAASCSSHVTWEDFAATLREGARRARCGLQWLERWGAPADHPRLLGFPEGEYLKVGLLRAE